MAEEDEDNASQSGITRKAFDQAFAFTVQLAGMPIAVLGIANLIAFHYHIRLVPLGDNIIANYRNATHLVIGGLYWLPAHYFHWQFPDWFHDVAVISIVSSGVSWRAFSGRDNPLTEWRVSLQDMFFWATRPDGVTNFYDMLKYIVAVVPMFIANLVAWVTGNLIFFLTRVRWIAGVCAASVRVTIRGLFLIGLIIMVDHALMLVVPGGSADAAQARRRQALTYFAYVGAVVLGVVYFFGELSLRGLK